jgi:hypothetical protein
LPPPVAQIATPSSSPGRQSLRVLGRAAPAAGRIAFDKQGIFGRHANDAR